ncbi:MAG: hypothetical protein R2795_04870 [Saprospiraceae bacterium]
MNYCWVTIVPEDKRRPVCQNMAPVEMLCSELPLNFSSDLAGDLAADPDGTHVMLQQVWGVLEGNDNCYETTVEELTDSDDVEINECGWGSITRRFVVHEIRTYAGSEPDVLSSSECTQQITILEHHDFVIDFPQDAAMTCGTPMIDTILLQSTGCDVLTVNVGAPVYYESSSDECYKYAITYDVINWCLWDGEYEGYVIQRMTEDDGEAIAIDRSVEGNERPVVRFSTNGGLCIDRHHTDRDGDSDLSDCASPDLVNYGRYIYTQFVKVYDTEAPVVDVTPYGATDCDDDTAGGVFLDEDGSCDENVTITFNVSDICDSESLVFNNSVVELVSATLFSNVVDTDQDGVIKHVEITQSGNVGQSVSLSGSNGNYTFSGTYDIIVDGLDNHIYYALRVVFRDACGNTATEIMPFKVVDCKGPAPICINGLTVTLMPQLPGTDADGDGDTDNCAMAIWASDFEGSPIFDCTGQGPETNEDGLLRVTTYAIYRASDVEAAGDSFVPTPDHNGLILTDDDEPTVVVYVYAFDEEGNYDYCETYVLVQYNTDCGGSTGGTIAGVITTEESETVEGVEVSLNGGMAMTMTTGENGHYEFSGLIAGGDYSVTPYLNANPLNGVTTFDLVLISKHILSVQPLNSPYKRIAADANRSGTITTLDMIQIRKLILNVITEFPNNTSWRFVDADYSFPDVTNPWLEEFPELISENNVATAITDADFVAVKIGDVNGSVQANALSGDDRTLNGQFNFEVDDINLKTGNVYTVAFRGRDIANVEGYQATLSLEGVELVDIEYGHANAANFGLRFVEEGFITTSWNQDFATAAALTNDDVLFSLVIRANEDKELNQAIRVSSRYTAAESYPTGTIADVGIHFNPAVAEGPVFALYQNIPNPFQEETLIGFNLPVDASGMIEIRDAAGKLVTMLKGDYTAGYNQVKVTRRMLGGMTGVLTYTVNVNAANGETYTAAKSMVVVK